MHRFILVMACLFAYSTPALAASNESQARPVDLIVSTTPSLEGFKIKEYLGIVRGVTVRQPTIGQGLSASLERLKGGHISAYVAMSDTARQQAYDLCLERARSLKADALVGVAYDSCGFDANGNVATEVVCYGTAVTVERNVASRPEQENSRVVEGSVEAAKSGSQIASTISVDAVKKSESKVENKRDEDAATAKN